MIKLPTASDCLFPTLTMINEAGGKLSKTLLYPAVINSMGITPEQLAVEFDENTTRRGPKVINRIDFALTNLKAIHAVNNLERSVWSITDEGRKFLESGQKAVRNAVREHKRKSS